MLRTSPHPSEPMMRFLNIIVSDICLTKKPHPMNSKKRKKKEKKRKKSK
jgi:hypothetical protein